MADTNLRRLERIAQSSGSPEAWAAYITAAVRSGEFDPLDWDAAISYLTKTPIPIRPNHQTLIEEGYGGTYQKQIERYHHEQAIWHENERQIVELLHQIRLINGHWGAQKIADHINHVFPRIFKENYSATVETAEIRRQIEDGEIREGVIIPTYLEGPEDVDTDVVSLPTMETFISFDEKLLVPVRRIRNEPHPATLRPINDFTTQVYVVSKYDYWTEAHGEQMSEVIEVARYNNPHQLMFGLIEMIQEDAREALDDIHHEREIEEADRLWEMGDS